MYDYGIECMTMVWNVWLWYRMYDYGIVYVWLWYRKSMTMVFNIYDNGIECMTMV